jgi:SAM-dependent methyltransferase
MTSGPDPTLEGLKDRCWREIASIDQALNEDRIDEDGWHAAIASLLKPVYLAGENPYVQAGHSGNAETWEASRGFIAEALHRSGTFLDAGCASGVLMESAQSWGARKNLRIEPYGLDIVPEFVELARRRLPVWADRIYLGNIRNWEPDKERFDIVLIRPEYAPATRRVAMIRHVIDRILKPEGRLIVLVGNEETALRHVESSITSHGVPVHGRVETPHPGDDRLRRRLFWIDAARA